MNVSRFIGADPEEALSRTISKFTARFHYVEDKLSEEGKTLLDSNLAQMDELWNEAKAKGIT
ncbi:Nucleoside triphosphate pyrophosphohydrolase/pyrophosphatase MazG [compost metagenome]